MQVGRQGADRPAGDRDRRPGRRDRTTWGKLVADGGNDDGIKDMDTLTRSRGKEGGKGKDKAREASRQAGSHEGPPSGSFSSSSSSSAADRRILFWTQRT